MMSTYAHTYSIAAIDPDTQEMGIAVQSHYFSVGSVVPWARAGVGLVATQALVNMQYGPDGLALLEQGVSPRDTLERLLADDEGREYRQLTVLAPGHAPATHTGSGCIAEAGHATGNHYSCQANMMLNDTVWGAMAEAFESHAETRLPERLLAALQAAEYQGGDIRGRQSAAITVVRTAATGRATDDRILDLRVEDHHSPLNELDRLLSVDRAYRHANAGDEALEHGDVEAALAEFRKAESLQPDILELRYWHAISLLTAGRETEGLSLLSEVVSRNRNWLELTLRLPDAGLADFSEALIARLKDL
ncbi:MAG: DUF1028 domain-containing protein [Spirochaetota bacterium]